jgi:hypothetical protein
VRALARRDQAAARTAMGDVLRYAQRRVMEAIGANGPVIQL